MMFSNSLRCCGPVKNFFNGVLALHNNTLQSIVNCKQPPITRTYAKGSIGRDCRGCCAVDPSRGNMVEPWPKPDSGSVSWKSQCSTGPQLAYAPYRIKVPDVMPPSPPSNVKRCGLVLVSKQGGYGPNQGYQGYGPQQGCQQGYQPPQDENGHAIPADDKDGGLMGVLKSFFGRGKKKSDDACSPNNQIVPCPFICIP